MNSSDLINISKNEKNYQKIGSFVFVSLSVTLLNLSALLVVLRSKKGSTYFLTNLFLASVSTLLIAGMIMLDSLGVINLCGDWLCGIFSFLKRIGSAILPLTVVRLSYERLKNSHLDSGHFSLKKGVLLTWGIAFAISFPSYFTYENFIPENGSKPYCKKRPLLGYMAVKVIYEGTICVLLHIFPSLFIFHCLFKMKFRFKYLVIPERLPQNLKEKLRRIRLIFLYSASFIVIWLPFGIMNFFKLVLEDPVRKVGIQSSSPLQSILNLLFMVFLALHPSIYLWAHNKIQLSDLMKLCPGLKRDHLPVGMIDNCYSTSAVGLETVGQFSERRSESGDDRRKEIHKIRL